MLARIAADIAAAGGRAYYVGGYVRDRLLGLDPAQGEDIDIEVYWSGAGPNCSPYCPAYGTARLGRQIFSGAAKSAATRNGISRCPWIRGLTWPKPVDDAILPSTP